MTWPAATPPPLKRLFTRLAFAPHPESTKSGAMFRILSGWEEGRQGDKAVPLPGQAETLHGADDMAQAAFTYRASDTTHDHSRIKGGSNRS